MKRSKRLAALCLVALLLGGCQKEPAGPVLYQGREVTVDQQAGTLRVGSDVYVIDASGVAGQVRIVYPNGQSLTRSQQGGSMAILAGAGTDVSGLQSRYMDIDQVLALYSGSKGTRSARSVPIGLCIAIMASGVFAAWKPRLAWQLEAGWRYKNAEPSELALAINVLGGVALALVGIVALLAG